MPGFLPRATAGHRREPCATAGVSWTQPRVPTSLWPRASVQTLALCSGGWGDSGRALAWAERGLAVGQETEEERGGTRVAEVTAAGVISTCVCAPVGGHAPLGGGHPPQLQLPCPRPSHPRPASGPLPGVLSWWPPDVPERRQRGATLLPTRPGRDDSGDHGAEPSGTPVGLSSSGPGPNVLGDAPYRPPCLCHSHSGTTGVFSLSSPCLRSCLWGPVEGGGG